MHVVDAILSLSYLTNLGVMVLVTLTNLGVMATDTSTQTSVVIIFSDLIEPILHQSSVVYIRRGGNEQVLTNNHKGH